MILTENSLEYETKMQPTIKNFVYLCMESFAISNDNKYIKILLDTESLSETYDSEWTKANALGDQTTDTNVEQSNTDDELKMLRAMLRSAINRSKDYIQEKIKWLHNWIKEHFSKHNVESMKGKAKEKWDKVKEKAYYIIQRLKDRLKDTKDKYQFTEDASLLEENELTVPKMDPENITSKSKAEKIKNMVIRITTNLKNKIDREYTNFKHTKTDKTLAQRFVYKWREINAKVISALQKWEEFIKYPPGVPSNLLGWIIELGRNIIYLLTKVVRYIAETIDDVAAFIQRFVDTEDEPSEIEDDDTLIESNNFILDIDDHIAMLESYLESHVGLYKNGNIDDNDHIGVYSYNGSHKNYLLKAYGDKELQNPLDPGSEKHSHKVEYNLDDSGKEFFHRKLTGDFSVETWDKINKGLNQLWVESEQGDHPKSWFSKMVFKLRKLYTRILARIDACALKKDPDGVFQRLKKFLAQIASNVMHLIDRFLAKIQRMAD